MLYGKRAFSHRLNAPFFGSKYYRLHGLKFQVVHFPDGMVGSVFGHSIRENDQGMLNMSSLNAVLEKNLAPFAFANGLLPAIYGDAIFKNRAIIVARPNKVAMLADDDLSTLHRRMASLRISIEHLFRDMTNDWRFLSRKENLKLKTRGEFVLKQITVTFFVHN
jgi:hypothetical protein